MVEIADIKDRGSLEEWLNTFSDDEEVRRKAAVDIAVRAALRVMPVAWQWFSSDVAKKEGLTALPLLRSSLLTMFSTEKPTVGRQSRFTKASLDLSAASTMAATASIDQSVKKEETDAKSSVEACLVLAKTMSAISDNSIKASAEAAFIYAKAAVSYSMFFASDPWSEILTDCVEATKNQKLQGKALWSHGNPVEILWSDIKSTHSPTSYDFVNYSERTFGPVPSGPWSFWIDWYEKVLTGAPQDWELLQAIVDHVDWDGTAEEVNATIAWIVAERATTADPAARVMAAKLMHAALADFQFDSALRLMKMRPFEEDLKKISDPVALEEFLSDAEDLREEFEEFAELLKREGYGRQGAGYVSLYLEKIDEEFSRARQLESLNIGKIVRCGSNLQTASLDENTRKEFGSLLTKPLDHLVSQLLTLVRNHFGATLLRFEPLKELALEPGTSAWEYLNELRHALRDLSNVDPNELTPLAEEDIAVLNALADEVERVMRAHDASSGAAKSSLSREINFQLALLTVSVSLYASRAREQAGTLGEWADALLIQVKRAKGLYGFLEFVKKFLDLP